MFPIPLELFTNPRLNLLDHFWGVVEISSLKSSPLELTFEDRRTSQIIPNDRVGSMVKIFVKAICRQTIRDRLSVFSLGEVVS